MQIMAEDGKDWWCKWCNSLKGFRVTVSDITQMTAGVSVDPLIIWSCSSTHTHYLWQKCVSNITTVELWSCCVRISLELCQYYSMRNWCMMGQGLRWGCVSCVGVHRVSRSIRYEVKQCLSFSQTAKSESLRVCFGELTWGIKTNFCPPTFISDGLFSTESSGNAHACSL